MSRPKVPETQPSPCVSVNQGGCSVSVVGPRVTVKNGAPVPPSQLPCRIAAAGPRAVMITPLSSGKLLPCSVSVTPKPPNVIDKVFLKAVSKDKSGKNQKIFTIRNINSTRVASRDDLNGEIRTQLQGDIVQSDFDVGFVSAGNSVVSIRNPADLAEVWADIRKGNKVVLWCDGLKVKPSSISNRRKRARESDDYETDEEADETCTRSWKKKTKMSAQEEREEKVQSILRKL